MHSLNQVNKLVSCGRDPARSLPLWRGFLLIPLILVCFAFAPNAQTAPETPDPPPVGGCVQHGGRTSTPFSTRHRRWKLGIRLVFAALHHHAAASILALVLERWSSTTRIRTRPLALLPCYSMCDGSRNTACGTGAMVNNAGDAAGNGSFNDAVGAFALNSNTTGFSNNAIGDSALFRNEVGAANTAVGDLALEVNDATGDGNANFNTAVGASALFNNVGGSSNTGVGAGVGPNLVQGFNNTYVGQFVGTNADDEDLTIRIGDISADGFGSAACFIGGIFNNPQPVGGNVVVVTLNLDTDQLGFDGGAARSGNAPAAAPHRNAPQPRSRPQPAHQAMLNDKVEKLQATVTEQQKQIETLTGQLREQAAQIQKVSAQLEIIRPTPRVVENR